MLPTIQLYRTYCEAFPLLHKAGHLTPIQAGAAIVPFKLIASVYIALQQLPLNHAVIVQRPGWAGKISCVVYTVRHVYKKFRIKEEYDSTMEVVLEKFTGYAKSTDVFGRLTKVPFNNMMVRLNVWDGYAHFLCTVSDGIKNRINLQREEYQSGVFGFFSKAPAQFVCISSPVNTGSFNPWII